MKRSWKGSFFTIFAATIWGTSFLFVKFSVDEIGYFNSLFFRLCIGAVSAFSFFILYNARSFRKNLLYFTRIEIYLLGFLNMGGYFFQFLGASFTGSARLALLVNSTAILVPLIAHFMIQEDLTYKRVGGMFLGFGGIFFLTAGGSFENLWSGQFIGDMFALLGGTSWAIYIVLSKKMFLPETYKKFRFTPINLSLTTNIFAFIFMIPLLPIYYHVMIGTIHLISLDIWLQLIYLGLFATTLAYTFYYFGLKEISATRAAFILLLEVIIATFLGLLVRNELFNLFHIGGAILIILAILIISLY
ncbi:MAG: DMT family transporter [Candidatus Helarchaeota archaeon]